MNISSNCFFTTRSYLSIFVGLVPLSLSFISLVQLWRYILLFFCKLESRLVFVFDIDLYTLFTLKNGFTYNTKKNRLISRSYNIPVSLKLKRKSNIHNTKIV